MGKKIEELIWKEFEKTGKLGMYMFYNALIEEERSNDGKHSRDHNKGDGL